jgi:hypothetical protein
MFAAERFMYVLVAKRGEGSISDSRSLIAAVYVAGMVVKFIRSTIVVVALCVVERGGAPRGKDRQGTTTLPF